MNLLAGDSNLIDVKSQIGTEYTGLSNLSISGLVGGMISIVMIVAAVIFFFMLVIGGLRWITSGGDKAQTEGARNQITAALVGLIIVFGAFAIATLVDTLFGINVFQFNLPRFV